MSGAISSAQARILTPDVQLRQESQPGEVSSHDLLKVKELTPEPIEPETPEIEIEAAAPEPEAKPELKPESTNFRQVRLKAEAAERESREKDEIIQRLLRAREQQNVQPQANYAMPDIADDDDSLLEKKHIAPLLKKVQQLEQQLVAAQQITTVDQVRQNLRRSYTDYDEIMTEDNLKDLEYMKPAVAKALRSSGDFEGAAETAYHMIKTLGIHQSEPARPSRDVEADKRRARENMAKPKHPSVIGKSNSPLGELSPYQVEQTQERKDAVWKRMKQKLRAKQG